MAQAGVHELGGDPNVPAGFPYAAVQHVVCAKLAADVLNPDRLPLEDEARVAGDHRERAPGAQRADQVLGQAVGEVLLIGIAAQVQEREHGDRGSSGIIKDGRQRTELDRRGECRHVEPIRRYGAREVFQRQGTKELEPVPQLGIELFESRTGHEDATGRGHDSSRAATLTPSP